MTMQIRDETLMPLAICRHALNEEFANFDLRIPDAPHDPQGWFEVLSEIVIGRPRSGVRLARIKKAAEAADPTLPAETIERYALLQTFLITLPRLSTMPIADSARSLFHTLCTEIATGQRRWTAHFDELSEAYAELVMMATLRYFFAGELSFEIGKVARAWLAKTHPLDLPQLVTELIDKYEGFGPFIRPHICRWRQNSFCLQRAEYERSLWVIAKTVEMQPEIKGLLTDSWLYSTEVGETSPHLAWLREFYARRGAFIIEMEPADPNAGFLVGSNRRRRLYAEKKFHPRQTIILWSRTEMLKWATAHPELGEPTRERNPASRSPLPARDLVDDAPRHQPAATKIRRHKFRSGQLTLVRATRFLDGQPRLYLLSVLIAPAAVAATAAAIALGIWAAPPVFALALVFMWLFQYFFLQ